jgi:hypothetical protein
MIISSWKIYNHSLILFGLHTSHTLVKHGFNYQGKDLLYSGLFLISSYYLLMKYIFACATPAWPFWGSWELIVSPVFRHFRPSHWDIYLHGANLLPEIEAHGRHGFLCSTFFLLADVICLLLLIVNRALGNVYLLVVMKILIVIVRDLLRDILVWHRRWPWTSPIGIGYNIFEKIY